MPLPTQSQLLLPLLAALADGVQSPREAADRLATEFAIPPEDRERRVPVGTRRTRAGAAHTVSHWQRTVRWVYQRARHLGLAERTGDKVWSLTPAGHDGLRMAQPATLAVVYATDQGLAIWGDAGTVLPVLQDGAYSLVFTSTPYPINSGKQYGTWSEADLIGLVLEEWGPQWKRVLRPDGSLVLNLGDAFLPGRPESSLWRERIYLGLVDRLGFHFVQPHYWHNPAPAPGSPKAWVTDRPVCAVPAVEHLYRFCLDPRRVRADNNRVRRPYSERTRRLMRAGGEARTTRRPSGHAVAAGAFAKDNGGAKPHTIISAANTVSNDAYTRRCKAAGLPVHPARLPRAVAEHVILLTTEEGDPVLDSCAGSGVIPAECERLGRPWTAVDISLTYLAGSAFRFDAAPGFREFVGLPGLGAARTPGPEQPATPRAVRMVRSPADPFPLPDLFAGLAAAV